MKITAIQNALKELGFLHVTHPADGNWDGATNLGYIQAAKKGNLHPSLWRQPSNIDQLPKSVRDLVENVGGGAAAQTHAAQVNNDAAKIAADAKAKAEAAQKQAEKQAADEAAKKQAEATAGKVNIGAEVKADGQALPTDAGTNAPDGAAADGQKPVDNTDKNTAGKTAAKQ